MVPVLIAGHHRLKAAMRLGWEKIECLVVEADDLDAELAEIDENLMRAELSPAERAQCTARRKEIYEARAKSGQSSATLTGRGNKGFEADTARATGASKRDINLDPHSLIE